MKSEVAALRYYCRMNGDGCRPGTQEATHIGGCSQRAASVSRPAP